MLFSMTFVICKKDNMVGLGGLEPPTSRLSGVRSNHLSYKPIMDDLETSHSKDGVYSLERR